MAPKGLTLLEKQQLFSQLAARLILQAVQLGYEVSLGECYRPPETAAIYAQEGKGIVDSVHCLRLAVDLNLFRDGQFLSSADDYRQLGEWWKSLSTDSLRCVWGGSFETVDADHFSVEHEGHF